MLPTLQRLAQMLHWVDPLLHRLRQMLEMLSQLQQIDQPM
jgi:hypothetical protein